jgi:hypothetical protein
VSNQEYVVANLQFLLTGKQNKNINSKKQNKTKQKPSDMKWKENEELLLRNRGGVFPGNERKQQDCARKQRNVTSGTPRTRA